MSDNHFAFADDQIIVQWSVSQEIVGMQYKYENALLKGIYDLISWTADRFFTVV